MTYVIDTEGDRLCSDCGDPFFDEHGHGVCFACKVGTVSLGSVPNMHDVSFAEQERQAVANAAAIGVEIERATDSGSDKRRAASAAPTGPANNPIEVTTEMTNAD